MTIIIHELDKINNSFNERLKYKKSIPCNCKVCQSIANPYEYRFNELLERYNYKKFTIECGKPPYHQVQVLDLIDKTVDLQQLKSQEKFDSNQSISIKGDIDKLIVSQGEKNKIMSGNRKINMENGNYNENIEGDYIQGNKIQGNKIDQSRNFQVGDVGGDFNPTNSPIMSDNTEINTSRKPEIEKNKINWGLWGTIIALVTIFTSASVSGLFNEEIRDFFNLNSPSETPEKIESSPAN